MNKKAQAGNYAVAFMIAVCLIILGIAWASPINEVTKDARNTTNQFGEVGGMDCDNSSISDFTKAGCLVTDISQGYFIGGIIALAGVIIAARIILA